METSSIMIPAYHPGTSAMSVLPVTGSETALPLHTALGTAQSVEGILEVENSLAACSPESAKPPFQ